MIFLPDQGGFCLLYCCRISGQIEAKLQGLYTSVTAQFIETQLMANARGSLGNGLQIMVGHFSVRSLVPHVISVPKRQRELKSFFFIPSFFFYVLSVLHPTPMCKLKLNMKQH